MGFKIYTKTGDAGETGLIGGGRRHKDDLRIEAYGTVDELNAWLGALADQPVAEPHLPLLRQVQDRLFRLGSILATLPGQAPPVPPLEEADLQDLEQDIDAMTAVLPPLQNFVLPGGHPANSAAHLARTVCRRAERLLVALNRQEPLDPILLRYLNRLSDWLFTLSRRLSQRAGVAEVPWLPPKPQAGPNA